MKKILCMLLALVLCVSFAACGKNTEKAPVTPTEAPQEPSVAMPDLCAAAKKLESVNSYRLCITMEQMSEVPYISTQTYMVRRDNGSIEILLNGTSKVGDMEMETDRVYYCNDIGIYGGENEPLTSVILEGNAKPAKIVSQYSDISADTESFLKAFAQMEPSVKKEDGNIICTKGMTSEAFYELFALIVGESADESEIFKVDDEQLATIKVDAEGYLRLVLFDVTIEGAKAKITFEIDMINEINRIEGTEFTNATGQGDRVILETGDWRAHYEYGTWFHSIWVPEEGWVDLEYTGMLFNGFGDYYYDDYVVPVYEVPEEIEGRQVVVVQNVLDNPFCSVKVERLVVPKGMVVCIGGSVGEDGFTSGAEETELFFHDTQEEAKYYNGTMEEEAQIFKAIYYAGQWEYVDGIPAPIE